jgi:hypothetical protein
VKRPPFKRVKSRLVVEEVVRGAAVKVGAMIEVDSDRFTDDLDLHRRYYLESTSKSPVCERYEPAGDIDKAQSFLVFLRETPDGLAYATGSAWETLDQLAEVKRLAAAR